MNMKLDFTMLMNTSLKGDITKIDDQSKEMLAHF